MDCGICLECIDHDDPTAWECPKCVNMLHFQCRERWTKSCPYCREPTPMEPLDACGFFGLLLFVGSAAGMILRCV